MWIHKRPEESITLTIVTGEKLTNKRIVESVQTKNGYWTHHILIDNKNEIDSEIEALIRTSYAYYLERKALKDAKGKNKKSG